VRYFKQNEFDCKCCGANKISYVFTAMLDEARHIAGIPFVINSGYRCKNHNFRIGGENNSSHLKGFAVDISAKTGNHKKIIVESLLKVGICRIGIAKNFIHCDVDPDKPQDVIWIY